MIKLEGITAISKYTGRSESTIMTQIQTMGFPATRTNANTWETTAEAVDAWRNGRGEPEPIKAKNKKSGKR